MRMRIYALSPEALEIEMNAHTNLAQQIADGQQPGVSPDGDRAGRPTAQAPTGLGDSATIANAAHTPSTGDVATLCAAALAVIQAFGGRVPDWIADEIQELVDALADVNHGPIGGAG